MPFILFSDFREKTASPHNPTLNNHIKFDAIEGVMIDRKTHSFNDEKIDSEINYRVEIETMSRIGSNYNSQYLIIDQLTYDIASQIFVYVSNMMKQSSADNLSIVLYDEQKIEIMND